MRPERTEIVLVVAATPSGVIGINGHLPWHIPEDMKHFRLLTTDKAILMGRKTYDSIGRPLPNRRNIVLSRDREWSASGVEVVSDIDEALQLTLDETELMVIGGEQIYRLAIPYADRIELTEVQREFDGDTYFPIVSNKDWTRTREEYLYSTKGQVGVNFVTLISRNRNLSSYLNLELSDLLQKFGEGRHVPGSGSAAALLGLLAARLVATVIKISYKKTNDSNIVKQFRYIDHQISTTHIPELMRLFDEDISVFDGVIQLRRERDRATNARTRKNIKSKERRRLQRATLIPIAIADHCLAVAEFALAVYRIGWKAVRGDSGAAISSAAAGALSATFVIETNLSRFDRGSWHQKWSGEARVREAHAVRLIESAVNAVEDLREISLIARQDELDFDM